MATIGFGDATANTVGDLPAKGSKAPSFTLVADDLSELSSSDLTGKTVISIFPSIGTGVCQASVRKFNELASGLEGTTVLNVSMDLPFALNSFCAGEASYNANNPARFRSTDLSPSSVFDSTGKNATIQAQATTARCCGR